MHWCLNLFGHYTGTLTLARIKRAERSDWFFLALQVQERIKKIWDAKLEVTEKIKGEIGLPRIVRLSRRLKLSEKETLVMIYTLTYQVSSQLAELGEATDYEERRWMFASSPGCPDFSVRNIEKLGGPGDEARWM